jgi:hypothetical protein
LSCAPEHRSACGGDRAGRGTCDGLVVQGEAWHEASPDFALRGRNGQDDEPFAAGWRTTLCGCHTERNAIKDGCRLDPEIMAGVEPIHEGSAMLRTSRWHQLLGLTVPHGSETRWGNDHAEMAWVADHLGELHALAETVIDEVQRRGRRTISRKDIGVLYQMILRLPQYLAEVSPRIDATTCLESNHASVADVLSALRLAHLDSKSRVTRTAAVYPEVVDAVNSLRHVKLLRDCETLRFCYENGGFTRILASFGSGMGRYHWKLRDVKERRRVNPAVRCSTVEEQRGPPKRTPFHASDLTERVTETLVKNREIVEEILTTTNLSAAETLIGPARPGVDVPGDPPPNAGELMQREVAELSPAGLAEFERRLAAVRARLAPIVAGRGVAVDGGEFDAADDEFEHENLDLEDGVRRPTTTTQELATQLEAEEVMRPDGDERDIPAVKAIRSASCQKRIAVRELRVLVAEYNDRAREIALSRGMPVADPYDEEVVVGCFEIYLSEALCASVRAKFDNESLEALWDEFAAAYAAQGGSQLADIMKRILSLPASEAQEERTIKYMRALHRKCGSGLSAATELSRLLKSTCRTLPALRAAAGLPPAEVE